MEGRALNREPRKQWAWLVPWFSGAVASLAGNATGADRVSAFIVGLAAGVVWQLLFRRDLTSRLTFMAVVVTVGLVPTLAARQEIVWEDMDTTGLVAIGILLGLIYTEHYQRWRDRAGRSSHPFADRWNHSTHYFPRMASGIPASAERILDVGCGEGTFARYVAATGRLVVGVDTDASVLPPSSHSERFAVASAEALPFPDGSFDAVTMTMVLHHVHADRALGEAVRVLAPGGVLLILGYGRYGGLRDAAHELRDVLTHRALSRRMQPWDPPTAKADPPDTWAGVQAAAQRLLPGSRYRRLPMWRYLVAFEKPPASACV